MKISMIAVIISMFVMQSVYAKGGGVDAISGNMVDISGGQFTMGDDEGWHTSKPAHSVSVPSFRINKYEVTQSQWQSVMGNNPARHKTCAECPIETVSWDTVQVFLQKLNQQTGESYRLPTEAEWEFAAKAGKEEQFNWGKEDTIVFARNSLNCKTGCSNTGPNNTIIKIGVDTVATGFFYPNDNDLYDMHGNISEMVQDCHHDTFEGAPADGSAWTEAKCKYFITKGGSYASESKNTSAATRGGLNRVVANPTVGFRLAQ